MTKRRCAFVGCFSVEGMRHLYSFPAHEPDVCSEWVRCSGNPVLAALPLEKLRRRYACENHFPERSFKTLARRRLWPGARPFHAAKGWGVELCEEPAPSTPESGEKAPQNKSKEEWTEAFAESPNIPPGSPAEKKPEAKRSEVVKAVPAPECVPIPAGTLLGKMYSGSMGDVCCLCLCEDGKILRSTNVYLKDNYTEGYFSMATLVAELQLDKIISLNSLDRLCESCIKQLSLFYLFKSKCTKLAFGLTNFYTFSESTKNDVTVVLPFESIHEYATKDENEFGETEEDRTGSDAKVNDAKSEPDPSTNKLYFNRTKNRSILKRSQSVVIKRNSRADPKQSKFTWQSELNRYNTVAKCIVQGRSYCSCCLTENEASLQVLETMLFMEACEELIPLQDILYSINCYSTNECEPALICQDCLNITIKAYNFKIMLDKSSTIVDKCISCIDNLVTNAEKYDISPNLKRLHFNFYVHIDKMVQLNDRASLEHLNNESANEMTEEITSNEMEEKCDVPVEDGSLKKCVELTAACHICGYEFPSMDEVQVHISSNHNNLLCCSYCNKIFKSRFNSLLEGHLENCRTTEKPFECDLCNMKFAEKKQLNLHRIRHFPKALKCEVCHRMVWSPRDLYLHIRNAHRRVTTGQDNYECTICLTDFPTMAQMKTHMLTHPSNSRHCCKYCGRTFVDRDTCLAHSCPAKTKQTYDNMNMRYDRNSGEKVIKQYRPKSTVCDVCGLVMKSAVNLENHKKTHMKKTDTVKRSLAMCDMCGRLFKSIRNLKIHMKNNCKTRKPLGCVRYTQHRSSKTGKMIYRRFRKFLECQQCSYKTVLKLCFELHMNKHHLKIKPYKCSVCEKCFHTLPTMQNHKKSHFRVPDSALVCNECGRTFKLQKCLMYHMMLHTGERPYPCDLCDAKFISASRRMDHRVRKHFEPTVQCNICLKFYYNQRSLREHIGKCHSGVPKKRKMKINHKNFNVDDSIQVDGNVLLD